VDILKYEPALFGELHFAGQVLAAGEGGTSSATTFTASGADFTSAKVEAGCVIYLRSSEGLLDGAYEIVSVDSAMQLTVSVVRADSSDDAVAPPAATDVSYRVSTFAPQASEVGFQLTEHFGIQPGSPASSIEAADIADTSALKRMSVFAVISAAYAILASRDDNENLWKRNLHYRRLFEKARERCRLGLDVDGDGLIDATRNGSCGRLVRE